MEEPDVDGRINVKMDLQEVCACVCVCVCVCVYECGLDRAGLG